MNEDIEKLKHAVANDMPLPRKMNALQKIQANLVAPKGQRNDFAKFNYRSCEDILKAVKPLLDELECTLLLTDKVKIVGERYYFVATATFTDNDGKETSVQGMAREPLERKGMDESQISGAASSYARKYALSGLFLLDDNKDADSVLNIAEAEIDAFTDLIEAGEAAKLFLMQTNDSDKYMALVKAATPKAGKVKFKENLNGLVMQAVEAAQNAAGYIKEAIERDDAEAIREAVEEMMPEEKQILWRQFTPNEQDHVKSILQGE